MLWTAFLRIAWFSQIFLPEIFYWSKKNRNWKFQIGETMSWTAYFTDFYWKKRMLFALRKFIIAPKNRNLELVKLYREQLFNESLGFHRFFTTKKDAFCFTENAWLGAVLVTKQKGCACVNFGLYHNGQDIQILSGNYKECFHLKYVKYYPNFQKQLIYWLKIFLKNYFSISSISLMHFYKTILTIQFIGIFCV